MEPRHPSLAPGPFLSAAEARIVALLRWTCVALFLGRAWQHLRWEGPYRALLWSQDSMEGPVRLFLGLPWETYAGSPAVDAAITTGIKLVGVFHLACAWAAYRCAPSRRWAQGFLIVGSFALGFLAYCSYRDKLHRLGEFVEHAAQFGLPLLLVFAVRGVLARPAASARFALGLRAAIACTFVGHGLYAVGFYPTPGEWVTMTMAATGLGETDAFAFLELAGLLDFVVGAVVMIPWIRMERPVLLYAAAWGLLTALARPVAFVRWDAFADGSAQWMHEVLVRLPHAALPLALLWLLGAGRRAGVPCSGGEPISPSPSAPALVSLASPQAWPATSRNPAPK